MNQVIPDAAVEAAAIAGYEARTGERWASLDTEAREREEFAAQCALEAAAPHMLSHEREETRLAHIDAVVNAQTVDRLERELAEARAEAWQEGWAHYRKHFSPNFPEFGINPYR